MPPLLKSDKCQRAAFYFAYSNILFKRERKGKFSIFAKKFFETP